jgi:DNA-directed RNA polymerase II subunit RPB4
MVPPSLTHAFPLFLHLGSLCCENADEAKTLIPSLADKIKDEDLQDLLDEISKLQNR